MAALCSALSALIASPLRGTAATIDFALPASVTALLAGPDVVGARSCSGLDCFAVGRRSGGRSGGSDCSCEMLSFSSLSSYPGAYVTIVPPL